MIPRKNRFQGHNVVSRVRGRTRHGTLVSMRIADSNKRKHSRVAVVVSKKISGKAVVRNRIRRRIYEAVRTQGLIEILNRDLVIYAKTADLASVSSEEIRKELLKLLTQP